jgi:hypothetical protein
MKTRQTIAMSVCTVASALLVGGTAWAQQLAPVPWIAGQPRVVEIAETQAPTQTVQVAAGGAAIHPSAGPAYWIYVDAQNIWHFRVTAPNQVARIWSGRITGASGPITMLAPTRPELQNQVRATPRGLNFAFATQGGIEGFDFRATTPTDCVRFYLLMDNAPMRFQEIILGGGGHAASHHFQMCKDTATSLPTRPAPGQPGYVQPGMAQPVPMQPAPTPLIAQPQIIDQPSFRGRMGMFRMQPSAYGQPRSMQPGAPAAYYIWTDPQGGWHLRTTTGGQQHVFRGRVAGQTAPITNVTPSRMEFQDRLRVSPRGTVAFAFATQGAVDGFDFRADNNACVTFNLDLAGGPTPRRIVVGAQEIAVNTPNFQVCNPAPRGPRGGAFR